MAVYKVPQDVEAEDKLIGPFSFRQFIYLIIAALAIFVAYILSQIFIGLLVIPLPIIATFLILALPLRKDQPMETYVIALIRFFLKPRRRIWDPEGTISLVRLTAMPIGDGPLTKGFGGDEAEARLSYLAQIVDTKGWSSRGATSPTDNLSDIFVAEASHAEDILDDRNRVSEAFEKRINKSEDARMQAARESMQQALSKPTTPPRPQQQRQLQPTPQPLAETAPRPTPQPISQQTPPTPVPALQPIAQVVAPPPPPPLSPPIGLPPQPPMPTEDDPNVRFNPYPTMRQHIIDPQGDRVSDLTRQPLQTTDQLSPPPAAGDSENNPSEETVSPDIMRLANTSNLSISAMAHEAHRLNEDTDTEEVIVSLR